MDDSLFSAIAGCYVIADFRELDDWQLPEELLDDPEPRMLGRVADLAAPRQAAMGAAWMLRCGGMRDIAA
jgi:hypothetical protein